MFNQLHMMVSDTVSLANIESKSFQLKHFATSQNEQSVKTVKIQLKIFYREN